MPERIIKSVVALLEQKPEPQAEAARDRLQVAVAALLVECACIDFEFSDDEREAIKRIVREKFDLEPDVADMLIAIAERRNLEIWNDWLFTEAIKRGFDTDEKVELIKQLWQVANADGTLHLLELQLVKRIATNLGIPDETLQELRRTHPIETMLIKGIDE